MQRDVPPEMVATWAAVKVVDTPTTAQEVSDQAVLSAEVQDAPKTSDAHAQRTRFVVRWDVVVFCIWLTGVILALVLRAMKHVRFMRLTQHWRQPLYGLASARLAEECASLGVQIPSAWYAPLVSSPMVVGLFRPVLLMPDEDIPEDRLPLMLRHELLHIRRRDLIGVALIELASCVHWFNPLLIWVRWELQALCELACDEDVLRGCEPSDRALYFRAMLTVLPTGGRLPLSTRFNGGVKNMKLRLNRLLDHLPHRKGIALIACVLMLALFTGNVLAVAVPEVIDARLPMSEYYGSDERMTDEEYDFVMGLRLPDYEQMRLAEWQAHLEPHAEQLRKLFNRRSLENDFMYMLAWDLDDIQSSGARSSLIDSVSTPPLGHVDGPSTFKYLSYQIDWQIQDKQQITVAQRNEVIRRVYREVCETFSKFVAGNVSETDLRAIVDDMIESLHSEPIGKAMDVALSEMNITDEVMRVDGDMPDELVDELLTLQVPGYLDMSVRDFDAMVTQHQQRIYDIFEQGYYWPHWFRSTLANSLFELRDEPDTHILTQYLRPIGFCYTIRWRMPNTAQITVRERDERLNLVQERIFAEELAMRNADGTLVEKSTYMAEVCARISRECSDDAMEVLVDDVRFERLSSL